MNSSNARIMTFNIRGSFWDDGINTWERRATLNVETIHRHDPGLIGFQEVQQGNIVTYRDSLPEYDFFLGPENGNHEPYDFNSIFWKRSQFEQVGAGGFWLSETPDRHSVGWNTAWVRAATWVKLKCTKTAAEFIHLNTHLDHISESARVEGSKLILDYLGPLKSAGFPVLVTGDFNCNPGSPSYRLYRNHGYQDTYLRAGNQENDNTFTFHAFQGDFYDKSRHHFIDRVDWVLICNGSMNIATSSCFIVKDNAQPLYPSDHYPVVSDLVIGSEHDVQS